MYFNHNVLPYPAPPPNFVSFLKTQTVLHIFYWSMVDLLEATPLKTSILCLPTDIKLTIAPQLGIGLCPLPCSMTELCLS